jgi:hypothetical protein
MMRKTIMKIERGTSGTTANRKPKEKEQIC